MQCSLAPFTLDPSISGCHELLPRNKYFKLISCQTKYEPINYPGFGIAIARIFIQLGEAKSQGSRVYLWPPIHRLENKLCFS